MGRNDAALDSMAALARPKGSDEKVAVVVPLVTPEPLPVPALQPAPEPDMPQPVSKAATAAPIKQPTETVAASFARVTLYLPPKAKQKFREIAFHEHCKEHDIYLYALASYLKECGHPGLIESKNIAPRQRR